jgi:DNA-binding MarR family transcriptional regulator
MMTAERLFNETRLLFHALKEWAESLHAGSDLAVPMRAVLELLLLGPAATVPEMARARGVSRQHIQQQVDRLLDRSLVERADNPAHRRSPKIALTDAGRALIQSMRADELNALADVQAGVSDAAIADAARVLSLWRAALKRDTARRVP